MGLTRWDSHRDLPSTCMTTGGIAIALLVGEFYINLKKPRNWEVHTRYTAIRGTLRLTLPLNHRPRFSIDAVSSCLPHAAVNRVHQKNLKTVTLSVDYFSAPPPWYQVKVVGLVLCSIGLVQTRKAIESSGNERFWPVSAMTAAVIVFALFYIGTLIFYSSDERLYFNPSCWLS